MKIIIPLLPLLTSAFQPTFHLKNRFQSHPETVFPRIKNLKSISLDLRASIDDTSSTLSDTSSSQFHKGEYKVLVRNIALLTDLMSEDLETLKDLVVRLDALEAYDPHVAHDMSPISNDLAQALAEAKATDDVCGPNSEESNRAWDAVDNVEYNGKAYTSPQVSYRMKEKAQKAHHQYSTVLDPPSLEAAIEAVGKIEHLARLVNIETSRIAGSNLSP